MNSTFIRLQQILKEYQIDSITFIESSTVENTIRFRLIAISKGKVFQLDRCIPMIEIEMTRIETLVIDFIADEARKFRQELNLRVDT